MVCASIVALSLIVYSVTWRKGNKKFLILTYYYLIISFLCSFFYNFAAKKLTTYEIIPTKCHAGGYAPTS